MDPITLTTLVSTSVLLSIEVVKFLKKNKHFRSSCCAVKIDNSSDSDSKKNQE